MSSAHKELSHPKYRPDIDGLRAVAVLSVVAFHAFPSWIKGGFVGVDVFFVISGYLISTIILKSLARGGFSFWEFYSRRIRRIFPALIIVLVFFYALGWFIFLSDEYKQLAKHMAAGAGFVSNFALWSESGYFDNAAESKPLLHLWSLGVEEQFYIVWPLVLWAVWKYRIRFLPLAVVLALASFSLNLYYIEVDSAGTFFWPQTRFWELLVGVVLAWYHLKKKEADASDLGGDSAEPKAAGAAATSMALFNTLSLLGLAAICSAVWFFDRTITFPGVWATIPVFGTALIIAAGPGAWVNRHLLSSRAFVWFGLISFPLYLWHWPIFSLIHVVDGGAPARSTVLAAVAVSIVLAWATFRVVEVRMRSATHGAIKACALSLALASVGLLGLLTYSRDGFPERVSEFESISRAAGEWEYPGKMTAFEAEGRVFLRQSSGRQEITLFVGDSNIEQYYSRIDELLTQEPAGHHSAVFATGGGCLAIPGSPFDSEHSHCNGLFEAAFQYARNEPLVRNVVIGSQWNGYLAYGGFLNGRFGRGMEDYNSAIARLSNYISDLVSDGKQVFLVLNIPTGAELDPKHMVQRSLGEFPDVLSIKVGGVDKTAIDSLFFGIQSDLKLAAEAAGARVVSPIEYLCRESICASLDEEGLPMYKDGAHLRPTYVRKKVTFLDLTLKNL